MPFYAVPSYQEQVRRDTVILDTNVLVAAFWPRDQYHEDARYFIDEWAAPFFVPLAVLVESWNMLVGSLKYWTGGIELLMWLVTPGNNVRLLPHNAAHFDDVTELVRAVHVDCVDSFLSRLADDVSRQGCFDPHVTVATYDTSDLTKCRERGDLRLMVFDLRSYDVY